MNIVNVGYDSTNYYVLELNKGNLLIDSGWPGTLAKLHAALKRKGIAPADVTHLLVTHFHPDHAGLTQELRGLGAQLFLFESQLGFASELNELFRRRKMKFVEIDEAGARIVPFSESRGVFRELGVEGEVLPTPGHSDDSVTLVLDDGAAFTGDLQPRFMLPDEDRVSRASWDRIYVHTITRIYPGHGG